jgi:hypothetical protein
LKRDAGATDKEARDEVVSVIEAADFADAYSDSGDAIREERAARARVIDEIKALGLIERAWELEVDGYTVLSREEASSAATAERVREAALTVAERRLGRPLDLEGGDQARMRSPFGQVQPEIDVLGEDPVFREALLNRTSLALINYLLGESCVLMGQLVMIKGPGPQHMALHTDQNQSSGPPPFPFYAQVANATWALTDYTIENGPICFVPGSHRLCRGPTYKEATDLALFEPVEAEAGSIILWHGNTWHGALRRTAPGLRISLVNYFGRWYHRHKDKRIREMLETESSEFGGHVTGRSDFERLGAARLQATKHSQFA